MKAAYKPHKLAIETLKDFWMHIKLHVARTLLSIAKKIATLPMTMKL